MAEFNVTMWQWRRMCDRMEKDHPGNGCEYCPARRFNCGAIFEMDLDTSWGELSDVVEKWAKEHPEPQYPTWGEFLQMTYHNRNYAAIFITPIPADIAEKLGVKPKGE